MSITRSGIKVRSTNKVSNLPLKEYYIRTRNGIIKIKGEIKKQEVITMVAKLILLAVCIAIIWMYREFQIAPLCDENERPLKEGEQ